MAAEINIALRIDKIPKEHIVKGKPVKENGEWVTPYYYRFTVGISDEHRYKSWSKWSENVSAWDWQSKEQRIVKKERLYLGSGSVHWTDGYINSTKKNPNYKK